MCTSINKYVFISVLVVMTVVFHPVFSCPDQNNCLFVLLLNVLLPRVCILLAKLARLFDDDEGALRTVGSTLPCPGCHD